MSTKLYLIKHPSHRTLYAVITTLVLITIILIAYLTLNHQTPPQVQNVTVAAQPLQEIYTATTTPTIPQPPLFPYIQVVDSCGPYFDGNPCVNMRSGPGINYPVINKLRIGMVLKVSDIVIENDRTWYKIAPDADLRFPERVTGDWFVAADVVHLFYDDGDHRYNKKISPPTKKRIVVDISEQTLYAYNDNALFMKESISTGLELTPTPNGTFLVRKMIPSRYMQGPLPGANDQYFDLPGVPWNLYFTESGLVIHGAYWHVSFGQPWSHGCINLPPEKAKELYLWTDIGTTVTVRN